MEAIDEWDEPFDIPYAKNNDFVEVPGHDKNIDFNTVEDTNKDQFLKDQAEHLQELEDIPMSKKAQADSYMEIIDEDIVKRIFANKW